MLLQFTEYARHYMSFAGTLSSSALIDVDATYLDGHQIGSAGKCNLIFKSGKLSQVICPSLVFTASQGE